MMNLFNLMPYVSYALTIIGYTPEIYALLYVICTKKQIKPYASNSIWGIWISAAIIYAVYAYLKGEYAFVLSNGITAVLCSTVFALRLMQPVLPPQLPFIGVENMDVINDIPSPSAATTNQEFV